MSAERETMSSAPRAARLMRGPASPRTSPPVLDSWARRHLPGLVIAAAAVVLVLMYRVAVGVPMWPSVSADGMWQRSGILTNPRDYLSYAAWARQGWQGHWWFYDLYTTQPHPSAYFNPLFYALGRLAALTGADVIWVMHLAALAATFGTVWLMFEVARGLGLSWRAAVLASALAAFSTGFSPLIGWLPRGSIPAFWRQGVDIHYCDTLPLTTFLVAPYQAIGLFNLVLLMRVMLWTQEGQGKRRAMRLGLTAIVAGWGVSSRPYEFPLMALGYGMYVALAGMRPSARESEGDFRAARLILLAMLLISGPLLLYDHWLSKQPVWETFAKKSLDIPFDRGAWIVGYGMVFWLALAGMALVPRMLSRYRRMVWIAGWAASALVALIVLRIPQTKLSGGVYLALCLLAALAIEQMAQRIAAMRWRAGRRMSAGGVALILSLAFVPGVVMVRLFSRVAPEQHDVAVGDVMQKAGVRWTRESTLLADPEGTDFLPAVWGVRLYCGHWALTPDIEHKREAIVMSGLASRPDYWDRDPTPAENREWLPDLIADARCQYVLFRRNQPAYALLKDSPRFVVQAQNSRWVLFRDREYLVWPQMDPDGHR